MTDIKHISARPVPMPYTTYRRWFGVSLVTASALAFGLVSQTINHLLMPGIPLYQPPFGAIGNILLAGLIGAALGFLVAWIESGASAVLWSSLLGALFMAIATLLTGDSQNFFSWQRLAAVAIIFFPTAAALAPLLILFRWAIGREEQHYRDANKGLAPSTFPRYVLPAVLLLTATGLGLMSPYNDLARSAVPRMHELIQQARLVQSPEALPEPLRPPDVKHFLEQGRAPYNLEWLKDDDNRFAIPRPAGSGFDQSTVIARFTSGYQLACMFPGQVGNPTCRDFPPP